MITHVETHKLSLKVHDLCLGMNFAFDPEHFLKTASFTIAVQAYILAELFCLTDQSGLAKNIFTSLESKLKRFISQAVVVVLHLWS